MLPVVPHKYFLITVHRTRSHLIQHWQEKLKNGPPGNKRIYLHIIVRQAGRAGWKRWLIWVSQCSYEWLCPVSWLYQLHCLHPLHCFTPSSHQDTPGHQCCGHSISDNTISTLSHSLWSWSRPAALSSSHNLGSTSSSDSCTICLHQSTLSSRRHIIQSDLHIIALFQQLWTAS